MAAPIQPYQRSQHNQNKEFGIDNRGREWVIFSESMPRGSLERVATRDTFAQTVVGAKPSNRAGSSINDAIEKNHQLRSELRELDIPEDRKNILKSAARMAAIIPPVPDKQQTHFNMDDYTLDGEEFDEYVHTSEVGVEDEAQLDAEWEEKADIPDVEESN